MIVHHQEAFKGSLKDVFELNLKNVSVWVVYVRNRSCPPSAVRRARSCCVDSISALWRTRAWRS